MIELPQRTVTLLFTDIEASTRLLHTLGPDVYEQALATHRRLLRDAFTSHGCAVVDTQGDAFLYAFPRATDGAQGSPRRRPLLRCVIGAGGDWQQDPADRLDPPAVLVAAVDLLAFAVFADTVVDAVLEEASDPVALGVSSSRGQRHAFCAHAMEPEWWFRSQSRDFGLIY